MTSRFCSGSLRHTPRSFQSTWINGPPHTAGAPVDSMRRQRRAVSSTIKHNLTTLNSLASQGCATFELVQGQRENVMHETQGHIEVTQSDAAFGTPLIITRPSTWSMTAIAGHDLRQPVQVIQNAHGFIGRVVRAASEWRLMHRLRDRLDELEAAFSSASMPRA